MKVIIASISLLALSFSSCTKRLPDLPNEPFDYSVSGIHDITVAANDFAWFGADVKVLKGDPTNEPITVTFENVPANVFLSKTAGTFKANYQYGDSFGVRNGVPGVYPIKAVFSSGTAGVKKYDLNLVITEPINRAMKFQGYFYPSGNCGYDIYVSCTIDTVAGNPSQLRLIDRHSDNHYHYGTFDTTYAVVDCCTNTFIIPLQSVQGTMVEGHGYMISDGSKSIVIERHLSNDSINYPCTVTLGN